MNRVTARRPPSQREAAARGVDDAPLGDVADSDALRQVELWFVEHGVPHFIERKADRSMLDAWARALPLLVVGYVLMG